MVRFSLLPILATLLLTSCGPSPTPTAAKSEPATQRTNQQVFQVKGVVLEVSPKEKSVRIRHEEVPGYMPAMTMPFDVKDTNELAGLAPGDAVSFRMFVTETEGWIDQIRKTGATVTNSGTSGPLRLARDVEPLQIGDTLPAYHFTNQFGQTVSTAQFKGQVLAINFLFTRCPFP